MNASAMSTGWTQLLTTRDDYIFVVELNYSESYTYRLRARTELEHILSDFSEPIIMSTSSRESSIRAT